MIFICMLHLRSNIPQPVLTKHCHTATVTMSSQSMDCDTCFKLARHSLGGTLAVALQLTKNLINTAVNSNVVCKGWMWEFNSTFA